MKALLGWVGSEVERKRRMCNKWKRGGENEWKGGGGGSLSKEVPFKG